MAWRHGMLLRGSIGSKQPGTGRSQIARVLQHLDRDKVSRRTRRECSACWGSGGRCWTKPPASKSRSTVLQIEPKSALYLGGNLLTKLTLYSLGKSFEYSKVRTTIRVNTWAMQKTSTSSTARPACVALCSRSFDAT
eukprot:10895944-Lingulodinium_polyedra.AAC.1